MMHPELPKTPASTGRVVIDFDGTLAEGVWPSPRIGKPIGQGIAILIFYANQGREVVVYTARPESHKERILGWLRMAGLQDHVYDVVCGKPVADLYIDDKAWNPWKEEGERAVSSGVPSQGSAPSKAASPSSSIDFTKTEVPTDDEDMCPNCVTPWKCNGPHESTYMGAVNG